MRRSQIGMVMLVRGREVQGPWEREGRGLGMLD